MTVFCDGENPTYPGWKPCEHDSGPGQPLWLYPTELCFIAIAPRRNWQEVGVGLTVGYKRAMSIPWLPAAVERAGRNAPPYLQFMVVEGLVLAKWVKEAYEDIWLEPSRIID